MKSQLMGLVAVAAVAVSGMAYAGAKWTSDIYISKNSNGSGSMSGTLGSIRNSSSTSTQLGCYYENFPPSWGSYKYASCYGYDGTQYGSCGTTDPAITDTISKLQGDSYLWVEFDGNGNCTRVQIGSQSTAPPKSL
jgi:hypothetical protein